MPLAVKGLTLGVREGIKYVPRCVLTVGGVDLHGEMTDLLFIPGTRTGVGGERVPPVARTPLVACTRADL